MSTKIRRTTTGLSALGAGAYIVDKANTVKTWWEIGENAGIAQRGGAVSLGRES